MNPCPRRYLFALAVGGWASSIVSGKESSFSLPPCPPENYGSSEALLDLAAWGGRGTVSESGGFLMDWLFQKSFGGSKPGASWIEHPRVCQAVWLALATHLVGVREADTDGFTFALEHFSVQKGLEKSTIQFFGALWKSSPSAAMEDSASRFLEDWAARSVLPKMSITEQKAVDQAVKAGVLSLRFAHARAVEKNR